VDNLLELVRLYLAKHVPMLIDIVAFCLLHLAYSLIHDFCVDFTVWVKLHNVRLHLFNCFGRHNDFTSTFANFNELEDLALFKIFLTTESSHSLFLLVESLVVFHSLIELRVLVIAYVDEILFLLKKDLLFCKLLVVLDHVVCSLLHVMQTYGQTDYLKFLLLDSGIVENPSLVQTEKLLLKSGLNLDNLLTDP